MESQNSREYELGRNIMLVEGWAGISDPKRDFQKMNHCRDAGESKIFLKGLSQTILCSFVFKALMGQWRIIEW